MPGFRRRMARPRRARTNGCIPNINTGCVFKFDENGEVLDCLWDLQGTNHPMITSMREHKGYPLSRRHLNNRIGKWRIPGADPNWTAAESYWGAGA